MLTNAAGSLDVTMRPGAIMLINDHINYAGMNPLTIPKHILKVEAVPKLGTGKVNHRELQALVNAGK